MTNISGQYLGRYYLSERLGEGGMATVYKAYDTRLEREVAVKIIRSGAFPPEALDEVLKRFEREAKSLAKLSHPNIVKVYDYGEHEGSPYLVMEYLPGGTLKKVLGLAVSWQEAVRLILPVARGIAYAHQRGILHRDIKPANILITESGEPMLSDFGIAKLFEVNQTTTGLTGSGMAIGTPEYMAPEQWNGATSPQSDLYSLAIVLYEMVAGRKPYIADTPAAILIKQATEPLPSPRNFAVELPEALELVLIKALAREPGDRYEDLNAFASALENLLGSGAVVTPEHKPVDGTSKTSSPQPVVSIRAVDTPESQRVGENQPSTGSSAKTRFPINLFRNRTGWLIGGLVVLFAAWLGFPLTRAWFSPPPVVTEAATVTLVSAAPTIAASQTSRPSQATATPALTLAPRVTPTPTPLLTEITDAQGVPMVLVPEGEFTMGSNDGDSDEQPIHQVYLDSYYIDKYEVTNLRYKECVEAGVCSQPGNTEKYDDPQYKQHPVVYMDWYMAKAYCEEWRGARLPTEAEWEKAARGTDGRTYPWGETIYVTYANYNSNIGTTRIVGDYLKGVSPYGGYDMAGNAWEWVADWYDENYYEVSTPTNPLGPETGNSRVLRGGGWQNSSSDLRSAFRGRNNPTLTDKDRGFRCALPVETSTTQSTVTPTPGSQRGFTLVDPKEVLAIAADLPTLGQLADEKYSLETRNRINSTLTFTVNLKPEDAVLWRWYWCAATDKILEKNMSKISLVFDADGYVIPKEELATVMLQNGSDPVYLGWKCLAYEAVLRDWQPGTYTLIQTTTFASDINDGKDLFKAGYMIREFTVNVSK